MQRGTTPLHRPKHDAVLCPESIQCGIPMWMAMWRWTDHKTVASEWSPLSSPSGWQKSEEAIVCQSLTITHPPSKSSALSPQPETAPAAMPEEPSRLFAARYCPLAAAAVRFLQGTLFQHLPGCCSRAVSMHVVHLHNHKVTTHLYVHSYIVLYPSIGIPARL